MSSHQIAIAKATFAASLLRPDPVPVSRDDIAHFHSLLSAASTQCSPANIQKCKRWILSNVIQSSVRVTALAKFMVALSTSFSDAERSTLISPKLEISVKRKRLHLLYLISDLIHHTKTHVDDFVGDNLKIHLPSLFTSAASFKNSPKHLRKIGNLLDIWEEKRYYSSDDINNIRSAVESTQQSVPLKTPAIKTDSSTSNSAIKSAKDIPFTMPAMHGDQSLPWYDLPAGNLMQHIAPNATRPIDPTLMKPILFAAGQAEEGLVAAVKSLLEEVESIYDPVASYDETEYPTWDVDEIGRRVFRDELGDVVAGDEGYYGWSTALCENMKKKLNKRRSDESSRVGRFRASNRDSSRSRSSSPYSSRIKKRRYSSSHDGRRSSSRSMSRSRSRSRSRDRGHTRYGNTNTLVAATDTSQPVAAMLHSTIHPYHP